MKMNKYLLSAFGAMALIAFQACTTEEFPEPSAGSGSETEQPAEMAGEIVVKFDASVSDMLDDLGLAKTRSGAPATRSGIASVDELLDLLGDCELERVFPVDERTEEKARQSGLHLWYVVRFSDKYSVEEVVERFSRLGEVQTATPNRTIQRAYRTDRKAIPLTKEMIRRAQTRAEGANGYRYNDNLLPYQWNMINQGYQDVFVIKDDPANSQNEEDEEILKAKAKFKVGADINCEKAWDLSTGDPSIVVAVLDEGVYWRHPDLQGNMWVNEDETYASHKDNDKNGYAGDYYGYDFINNTGIISCDASDDTGHGTHVAGVIAARNNNSSDGTDGQYSMASIAGGTDTNPGVRIMSCQIFSGNSASNSISLVRAIKYAADNGAVILQCSWGYVSGAANGYENAPGYATQEEWETYCPLEKAALDYFVYNAGSPNGPIEGGIPIFSSGNEYAPAAGFPGAADYCVAVNAIAADFTVSTFSNYGTGSDISAPGGDQDYYYEFYDDDHKIGSVGCILSTMPPHVSEGTGYGYMEGTSMACPHVSGVAALGLSYAVKLRKHFTAAEFRKLLVESATPIDDYFVGNKYYYHYVVDLGTTYYKSIPLSQYVGKAGGLVNAQALLEAIADNNNGTEVSFPNIYLGIGDDNQVIETPARYFKEGEGLTYTLKIDNSSIAKGEITAEGKAVFTGLAEGVTTASITASNGEVQKFNITVRKSANGSGWL